MLTSANDVKDEERKEKKGKRENMMRQAVKHIVRWCFDVELCNILFLSQVFFPFCFARSKPCQEKQRETSIFDVESLFFVNFFRCAQTHTIKTKLQIYPPLT